MPAILLQAAWFEGIDLKLYYICIKKINRSCLFWGGAMSKALFNFICMLAVAFLTTACGPGNSVQLLPPPPLQASNLPSPNAPSISVVNFKDERPDPHAIGVRRDGSAFTTIGDVSSWVSRALADELARMGFRVTFAMDTNQARSSSPDYLLTGQVDQVWVKENSATDFVAQMRVNCTLANRKGKLWNETCNSSQNRAGLPSGSFANDLLLDTLRDLIKPIANKVLQTVETKK